jgi:2-desacetyl-2-hydroxyethyl bacteriochlorophyllide A dehydrogenase
MKAKAVVAVKPWHVEFRDVDVPSPGDEDVVVHVTHSWISNGTEGSFIRAERIAGDTPRAKTDPLPFPQVPGYQKVGIVEWTGSAVKNARVGDAVFASISNVNGMFYDGGGHVSPAVTHASQVWKLPEGLEPVAASGLVLTQVGYNVGMRPRLEKGDRAVVIGDGQVGHWAAQTLQHRGARVLMLGRHDDRLGLLRPGPEDRVVNTAANPNWMDQVRAWAPEGLQAVADTVGSIRTLEQLIPIMRHEGGISSAGFYGHEGRIDIQLLRNGELTLYAPSGWSKPRMDATLELLSQGALSTLHLISHRIPVEEASRAYDMILLRTEPVLGVVLDW